MAVSGFRTRKRTGRRSSDRLFRRSRIGFGPIWRRSVFGRSVSKLRNGQKTVREASGVLFGVRCKDPASWHLAPLSIGGFLPFVSSHGCIRLSKGFACCCQCDRVWGSKAAVPPRYRSATTLPPKAGFNFERLLFRRIWRKRRWAQSKPIARYQPKLSPFSASGDAPRVSAPVSGLIQRTLCCVNQVLWSFPFRRQDIV